MDAAAAPIAAGRVHLRVAEAAVRGPVVLKLPAFPQRSIAAGAVLPSYALRPSTTPCMRGVRLARRALPADGDRPT